jgi:hypothetical protein
VPPRKGTRSCASSASARSPSSPTQSLCWRRSCSLSIESNRPSAMTCQQAQIGRPRHRRHLARVLLIHPSTTDLLCSAHRPQRFETAQVRPGGAGSRGPYAGDHRPSPCADRQIVAILQNMRSGATVAKVK